MNLQLFALLIALAPAFAVPAAAELTINAPAVAAPGSLVVMSAEGRGQSDVRWVCIPDSGNFLDVGDGRGVFASGAAGRYTFVAAAVVGNKIEIAQHTVVVGQPAPEPGPTPVPPSPTPTPNPSPTPPTPEAEFQALVAPVREILATTSAEDRTQIALFYRDFATVLANDTSAVTSTGALRDAHIRAGQIMFQARLKGKYPGLAEAADAAIAAALTLENRPLDAALRSRAVDVFNALAWAAGGA